MQNLILKHNKNIQLSSELLFNSNDQFVFDGYYKVGFFTLNNSIYSFELNSKQIIHRQNFKDFLLEYNDNNFPKIAYSCYIIEDELVLLLFTDGLIITYDTINDLLLKHSLNDIDYPKDEIDCGQFSHDQELFVIITRNNRMLLYNKLLVLKRQYDLNTDEYGAAEMINVNWGSKSTQFHGQGMRDHRNVDEKILPLTKWDDHRTIIDWKHDDNQYVINFVSPKGYRILKIFNREGILEHTSELVSGLEKTISWKPSGTLLASSILTDHSHEIVFFERNGLKHGQFKLPFKINEFQIDKISWSYDSSVLLVSGTVFRIKYKTQILLYTRSNYHWYLKKRIYFENDNFYIHKIIWNENEYLKFHMISVDCKYYDYYFELERQTTNNGSLFLIDGNQLNVSDVKETVIPPPLFTYSIQFTMAEMIDQIFFNNEFMAIILNDDYIIIMKSMAITLLDDIENNKLCSTINYQFENVPKNFQHVYLPIFFDQIKNIGKFLMPFIDNDGRIVGCINGCKIGFFDYQKSNEISLINNLEFDCYYMTLLPNNLLLIIDSMNKFYQYKFDNNNILVMNQINDNDNVYDGKILKLISINLNNNNNNNELHYIILTKNYSLYYDKILIKKCNVNSFILYKNDYLLFTTIDNKFYCWPINCHFDILRLEKNFPHRNLEQGSILLAISEINSRVIVELPRGNLETFHPRIFILNIVDEHLNNKKFIEAFEILRKNRINLNYLCDYNFDMFMKNCENFIKQLGDKRIDWLCLFLFDLSPDNYYNLLKHNVNDDKIQNDNKINLICNEFIDILTKIDERKFLKPIILCHVKKEKCEIDKALFRIYQINDVNLQTMAIKFLLSIVDTTKLIEEALGTYDFNILLMVVSKSNKDPKEYQMLINDFQCIDDDNYRKYRIDLYLHRYRKCLQHLQKCSDKFEEALHLIDNKHLYNDAVEIYGLNVQTNNQEGLEQIWTLYGNYLFKKCYYQEAGLAYERAKNYLQAYKMYVQSGDWNKACYCARNINNNDDDQFRQLINSLQQNLIMNGNYNAAAYITEQYLNDFEEAFRLYLKGHHWFEAIRLHQFYKLDNYLIDKELRDEIINSYNILIDITNEKIEIINQHLQRLKELKEIHSKPIDQLDNNNIDLDSYSDTSSVCDTSSLQSFNTKSTNQSLKTNVTNALRKAKRMEQKKYFLKKGSTNEDLQIIYATKELIGESFQQFQEGHGLIKILYDRYHVEQSKILQTLLQKFELKMNDAIEFIWKSDNYSERLKNDEILRTIAQIPCDKLNYKLILNDY